MDSKQCFKKSTVGKIPCEWENAKLIDAVDKLTDGSHFSPKEVKDSKFYIATVKDMSQYKINLNSCKKISEQDYVKLTEADCKPEKGDVLFSKDGTMGLCFVYSQQEPIVLLSSIAIIRPNYKLDPYFLKYYLSNASVKEFIVSNHSSGSALPRLTLTNLKEIPIIIPALREQQSIAKILSDLDSKIELNQKMNKTLESIAQAIFRHWFIDFEFPNEEGKPYKSSGGEMVDSELGEIPKGWQVKYFKDIVSLTMGVSPKGNSYNTDGFGVPLLNGAADFSNGMIEPKKFTTNPVKTCKEDDLLFCIRATIGNLTYSDREYCIGRGVAALSPINKIFKEYSYFTLEYGLHDLISKASGSVIRGLSKNDIFLYKVLVPKDKIMAEFHLLVSSMFSRIRYLKNETRSLSALKDSLLPKLMLGKIRVPLEE